MEHNKQVSQNKMKVVNILSSPSSLLLAQKETQLPLSHIESVKPNLKQLICAWEKNAIRGSLATYPTTFAISFPSDFTLGLLCQTTGLMTSFFSRVAGKHVSHLERWHLVISEITLSLLLSSVITCGNMHNRGLPLRISHVTKKTDILGFSQHWHSEQLQ